MLRRAEGDRAEFVTVSFWESREAIEGFVGQDIEKAVSYPEDERFLVERDLTMRHYEVTGTERTGRLAASYCQRRPNSRAADTRLPACSCS